MKETLNIADINVKGTYALGPGKRIAIWVQGCPFRCSNCSSPDFLEFEEATKVNAIELAESLSKLDGFSGVSISGGEPFSQSGALSVFLEVMKSKKPEWTVIVFSGYKLNILKKKHEDFLKKIDLLIDGLYVDKLNDNKGLRGSTNQKLHFLSNRLKSFEQELSYGSRIMEFSKINEEIIQFVGIKPKDFQPNF